MAKIVQANGALQINKIKGATMPDGFCVLGNVSIDVDKNELTYAFHCFATEEEARHDFHPEPATIVQGAIPATSIINKIFADFKGKTDMANATDVPEPVKEQI